MQAVTTSGTQSLEGKTTGTSGSANFGVGTAKYSASAKLRRASVSINPGDLTNPNAVVGVEVAASAGVDVLSAVGGALESAATTTVNAVTGAAKDTGKAVEKAFKSY